MQTFFKKFNIIVMGQIKNCENIFAFRCYVKIFSSIMCILTKVD
jgi:hypothetical protein